MGTAFYTTVRVRAACISAVGVGVMLPSLLLLVPSLHNGQGKRYPSFIRWCRRYAAHFSAVGAAFYTTASIHAARFLDVGVGVVLPVPLR